MKKRIPAIILMFALFLTTSYAANTYRKTIAVWNLTTKQST